MLFPIREAYADDGNLTQDQNTTTIKGLLLDDKNSPVIGATVFVEGTTNGVVSDVEGNFSLTSVKKGETIVFSSVGYTTIKKVYNGENMNDFRVVQLYENVEALGEVSVVAFGTQKKESVVSAITTVNPSELKIPSSNLTQALAGRVAGMIAYQRSGEPGEDNAEFFIRGVTTFGYAKSPLILIDGMEMTTEDFSNLNTDDIENFSILKDATAAAMYGARGANGVILVTTKEGYEGATKFNVRFENSISANAKNLEIVDPIRFMNLHNEATIARSPSELLPHSQEQIDMTAAGGNPNIYPAINWYDKLFKDFTANQRLNLNMSGGGKVARFYISANYSHESGLLKVDKRNNFNQNININTFGVRSTVNLDLTKTTKAAVRVSGRFTDYMGPVPSGGDLFNYVVQSTPVGFPAVFEPDKSHELTKHILFGNSEKVDQLNPYAEMVNGYKEENSHALTLQITLDQDLKAITEGLSAKINFSTDRSGSYAVSRLYRPHFYSVVFHDTQTDEYVLENTNEDEATEFLNFSPGLALVNTSTYIEGSLQYTREFNEKHSVGGVLIYTMRNANLSVRENNADLQSSLPFRNIGLAGRLTYGYDSRYFIEANFGYNGSERFAKEHRFGFFPAVGVGYMISNEKFFKENISEELLTSVKFKASYGLVGNDQIGKAEDRFFYLSHVNLKGAEAPGFGTGMDQPTYRPTTNILRYANEDITWEISKKMNFGIEARILRDFTLVADYFREDRSNILMDRSSITDEMGFEAPIRSNVGEAWSHGIDGSLDYDKSFRSGLWLQGRFNFTYATSEYKKYEEQLYTDAPWRQRVGTKINQEFGYIAERLFYDQADINNSPMQFGKYMAGDIKYRDVNRDGVINDKDLVPIGYPTAPEVVYGFGFSMGYKGFDISAFFQGSARSSFWIDQEKTTPFTDQPKTPAVGTTAMLNAFADSYWSESNQDPYALWPRLSTEYVENNNRTSTWFMNEGSFLRLKNVEIGYTFNDTLLKKIRMSNMRIYMTGANLLTFSKFKLWDVEMASNGLGYPIQRVYNLGIQIGF